MAGIKDIARQAGVSVSTVSNVLNGKKNVGEETREKIYQICRELGYVHKPKHSTDEQRDNKNILFVFSEPDRQFYLQIIRGIRDFILDKGYNILISTNENCESLMRKEWTCGCIVQDIDVKEQLLRQRGAENYPIVVLDRNIDLPFVKCVVVNNYAAMCEMVQRIIDCGYRRFAFLGGIEKTEDTQERFIAFRDTLKKNQIEFLESDYYTGDYREKSGYIAGRMIALREKMPEVVICANDSMAAGVIKALQEKEIRVPEDISVTGFDNTSQSQTMGLTTVTAPNYERGYLAAQALVDNLEGQRSYETFRILARVVWRESVKLKDK